MPAALMRAALSAVVVALAITATDSAGDHGTVLRVIRRQKRSSS